MEAIAKYKQALSYHGEPSHVLENHIGLSYYFLEQYNLAIVHYSNAIQIKDTSVKRVNRSLSYVTLERCDRAIPDALAALALEPAFEKGFHTDMEANYILSDCYFWDEEYLLSLQHIEAALSVAKQHQYSDEYVAFMDEEREIILSYLN